MTQVNSLLLSLIGIAGIVALAWWLSHRWVWGRRLGVAMLVLLLGVAVRNGFGWQADERISAWISGPLTSLAIAELLLAIRLKSLLHRARPLLLLFGVAVHAGELHDPLSFVAKAVLRIIPVVSVAAVALRSRGQPNT